jgi:hypothetical protein
MSMYNRNVYLRRVLVLLAGGSSVSGSTVIGSSEAVTVERLESRRVLDLRLREGG